MTISRPFRRAGALVVLLACMVLSAGTNAQEAPPAPERDERTDLLFHLGMTALGVAERTDSDDERQDMYDKAIDAFRAILVNRPELVRVRLELARTFFLNGQDGLARRHFELVLASGPPAPVAANIQRFLAVMRARKRLSGYFGAAIAPDSNLNAASESEIIYLDTVFGRAALPARRRHRRPAPASACRCGAAASTAAAERAIAAAGGPDVAVREYPGGDFDQTFLAVHTGPRWLAGPITDISLLATTQRQWLGDRPYIDGDRRAPGNRPPADAATGGARRRGVAAARLPPQLRLARRLGQRLHPHSGVDAGARAASST